jgi:hypothetical protein
MDCVIHYGNQPTVGSESQQLLLEHHIAVCSPKLLLDRDAMRASCLLHVFDDRQRFPLWEDWLAIEANHPDFPINTSRDLHRSSLLSKLPKIQLALR